MDAEALVKPLVEIIRGLRQVNIRVVSYSCDGTEVERAVERLLLKQCTDGKTYKFKHPIAFQPEIIHEVPLFEGVPLVPNQDSKHLLKTFRNNLFSGARVLIMGNDFASYDQVRDIAFHEGPSGAVPPLYHRDVEKLDRQDDRAASRLFSAATLAYVEEHFTDRLALRTYLFICGEIVEACQNRHISMAERLTILYRGHFFFELWRKFLELAGYSEAKHFVSRECYDILNIFISAQISLILVYRDNVSSRPFVPWLHSTETCEHIFGECRKLCPDFTMLDLLFLLPKLHRIMLPAIVTEAPANERAAGYHHTYFKTEGIDFIELQTFPNSSTHDECIKGGYNQAHALWKSLGFIHNVQTSDPKTHLQRLPSISQLTAFDNMAKKATSLLVDEDADGAAQNDTNSNVPVGSTQSQSTTDYGSVLQASTEVQENIMRSNALIDSENFNDRTASVAFAVAGLDAERHTKM